jgi:acyl carrier protein
VRRAIRTIAAATTQAAVDQHLIFFIEQDQHMSDQTPAEHELAELIVSSLNLEHVKADAFDPHAPLFGAESGLDSIDALELALAVSKRYGFQLRSDNADNKQIFSSLRTLSAHIEQHRAN